jgi:hypothetical protein
MRHTHNERGIALVLAIFALVVVGGLVAGAFFVGMQEQTVGKNTVKQQQAFGAADGGTQGVVANWTNNTAAYSGLTIGDSTPHTLTQTWLADSSGWYRYYVKRLSNTLYLVSSEGFSRDSTGRQRVGGLVRLRTLELVFKAALEIQAATQIGGSSAIDGSDHAPTGWTGCLDLQPTLGGVAMKDTTLLTFSGGGPEKYLSGSPLVKKDTTLTTAGLTTFGSASFNDLAALANKTFTNPGTIKIQPSLSGAACNTGDLNNWGDPLNPTLACGAYFPIIYVNGDVSINGVQGQGILVVSGDLSVQGGFEFYGPVIVKGHLKTTGTGGHFNGGVIAADVDLEPNSILGGALINYNSCALMKALTNSAVGGLMNERGWVNLN